MGFVNNVLWYNAIHIHTHKCTKVSQNICSILYITYYEQH